MRKILSMCLALVLVVANAPGAMAVTQNITVNATVQAGTSSLTVTPGTLNFGTLPIASSSAYRFSSGRDAGAWTAPGPISVSYFPAAPYEIRVYTDNNVGATGDPAGYLPAAGGKKLFLKVWSLNYGLPQYMSTAEKAKGPISMNPLHWKGIDLDGDGFLGYAADGTVINESALGIDVNGNGNATDIITSKAITSDPTTWTATSYPVLEGPFFLTMIEADTMKEGFAGNDAFSRRRLSYNHPTDAELDSPFSVYLGMDLRGVAAGAYSGTVTFELYTY